MRTAALLVLALVLAVSGRWRSVTSTTVVRPLLCDEVVAIEEGDAVRLACPNDAALHRCEGVRPGRRYRDCVEKGGVVGPLLMARGQPLSLAAASKEDLRALPDVGRSMAQKLDDARRARPLCRAGDLESVPGIGPKKAAKLAAALAFDDPRCR
ncbi:MAG: Helix-hairpin-helix motif [Pseudomonadota bacterium]|jgi:hypothetical protein